MAREATEGDLVLNDKSCILINDRPFVLSRKGGQVHGSEHEWGAVFLNPRDTDRLCEPNRGGYDAGVSDLSKGERWVMQSERMRIPLSRRTYPCKAS